ncbi:MAG: DJ-1 family glyoxalase III [Eubacteriales bacterium]
MVYLFLADGFEEIEALTPVDMLRRAGVKLSTVSITENMCVTGSHGIQIISDYTIDELDKKIKPEMVILPGGGVGTENLAASAEVKKILTDASKNGAYIAAICAAPSVLGKMGLLSGREAVCYPGFEKFLTGAKISDKPVAVDGKFITARGMGVSLEFSLALVAALCGQNKSDELKKSVMAI